MKHFPLEFRFLFWRRYKYREYRGKHAISKNEFELIGAGARRFPVLERKGGPPAFGWWGKVDCCMLEQRVVWLISRKSKITWMVCPFWVIIGNIFMLFLHPNIEDSTFHWLSFILQHKPECWWLDKGKNSKVSHSGEQLSPMLYVRRNMFEQGKLDFFYSQEAGKPVSVYNILNWWKSMCNIRIVILYSHKIENQDE